MSISGSVHDVLQTYGVPLIFVSSQGEGEMSARGLLSFVKQQGSLSHTLMGLDGQKPRQIHYTGTFLKEVYQRPEDFYVRFEDAVYLPAQCRRFLLGNETLYMTCRLVREESAGEGEGTISDWTDCGFETEDRKGAEGIGAV